MQFSLTEHARKRILQRGIKLEWIERALTYPAHMENDTNDDELVHVMICIPERGFKVLRVIFNESIDPVAVVTAFFDDRVSEL